MNVDFSWRWPRRPALLYCLKVAVATFLGYLLALGGTKSAVYSAMSAALIVGASRGEDVLTSTNRVRGTLAGMLVGIALTLVPLPPALAVAVGVGSTAYVCLAFGWGVPAARVGAALCAVMILVHLQDAFQYSLIRVGNTLIGIATGLAVSYLVLPVRGREVAAQASEASLAAASNILAQLASTREPIPTDLHVAMLDRLVELEKAIRDGRREFGKENASLVQTARQVGTVCAGTLTAAIAHSDLCSDMTAMEAAAPLFSKAAQLAERTQATGHLPSHERDMPSQERDMAFALVPQIGNTEAVDLTALQGLALGLRKIEAALCALGR